MVQKALTVAEKIKKERNISIEIIDPISLSPLDMDPIIESVKKTGKVVIAYNDPRTNGDGTEISERISEETLEYLDSPICRVAEKDCPIPFAPILETAVTPQEDDLIETIEKIIQ